MGIYERFRTCFEQHVAEQDTHDLAFEVPPYLVDTVTQSLHALLIGGLDSQVVAVFLRDVLDNMLAYDADN